MTTDRSPEYLAGLVHELRKLPKETEWVEFKVNHADPEDLGQYISALANSAAVVGKAFAYLVWGIEDATHDIVGTTFSALKAKVGNEDLENWLLRHISPNVHFRFREFVVDGKDVVLLEIPRAIRRPVQFRHEEFIRVGSYKKKLRDHSERERDLWRAFEEKPFEDLVVVEEIGGDEVLQLLDYPAYFDLLKLPLPEGRDAILSALASDELIQQTQSRRWNVTNLGAILFARKLSSFRSLRRKAMRVIVYRGDSRVETIREQEGSKGYASGFEGLIGFVNNLLPANEVIGQALRKSVPMYPELAVRELVANALIHQDLSITGAGPMIEIFDDRMEISNPGKPLVEVDRFLDTPPRSRNESLASFMRRIGVCEERGSGVDKVVFQTEFYQLPAPAFEVVGDGTRAVLFAPRPLAQMDKVDRVRACYLHACLRYVSRKHLTNTSLRERFGIDARNSATASRLIKETIEAGLIRPFDESVGRKLLKYVPYWA